VPLLPKGHTELCANPLTEKLKIIGRRIFLIIVDKFILQIYGDNVSLRNKPPNAKFGVWE
jgi:hypothetical protein